MAAVLVAPRTASPFDLADDAAYRRWRAAKLARAPQHVAELCVDLADPAAPTPAERRALLERCAAYNMVVYRGPAAPATPAIVQALGRSLGLTRLDANWLAGSDGVSAIEVSDRRDGPEGRGGFIPYTPRAIGWHTDGYYHPPQRSIRTMLLHCVRAAASGGTTRLVDHELAYIALRDANPEHVAALCAPDAMTIPARLGDDGVARPAQGGPVFSVDAGGALHMRYTARTRSIAWKPDPATAAAVAALQHWLAHEAPVLTLTLRPGMGIVAHNVLHERSAFADDPQHPRLLYRARYLDRVAPCRTA